MHPRYAVHVLIHGTRPVALRPTSSSLAYAGLILHALYSVPQVRHTIAEWSGVFEPPPEPPTTGPRTSPLYIPKVAKISSD